MSALNSFQEIKVARSCLQSDPNFRQWIYIKMVSKGLVSHLHVKEACITSCLFQELN